MKVVFTLKDSMYHCRLQITDSHGSRYHLISVADGSENADQSATVEIYDSECDLSLSPLFPDINAGLNEFQGTSWKEKFAIKAAKVLFSAFEKMILRVGCTYHIQGLQDGSQLDITLQCYAFGTFDKLGLLELIPMMYTFFEVSQSDRRFRLTDAYEINRKEVIKAAKSLSLADILGNGIFALLFSYPIQMGRVKWLSSGRKIRKTLFKFNGMSDSDRQKFLEKQDISLDI